MNGIPNTPPDPNGQVAEADVNHPYRPFSTEEEVTAELLKKLNAYQVKANMFDEETPYGLSKQIEILSRSLGVIGDLWAQSIYRYKRKSTRKSVDGDLQEELARLDAEREQWERAYKSMNELINAKKITQKVLMAHYYGKFGD